MTNESMRLVLAEFEGWKIIPNGKDSFGVHYNELANRGHETILASKLPDYPNDITAMIRVAEKMAKDKGITVQVGSDVTCSGWYCRYYNHETGAGASTFNPTASLAMCEAAVRALGKYVEE